MVRRRLGRTGIEVAPIGFGAFKIGRNEKVKYAKKYDLPSDEQVSLLVRGLVDLGINFFDTAPAYGRSESRLGPVIQPIREQIVLCTKAGETFADGQSHYAFDAKSIQASVEQSLKRLQVDAVDVLLIHSDGRDMHILEETDAVACLHRLRDAGLTRSIGFSGKTTEGAAAAMKWADVLMVEYHLNDTSHADVMTAAAAANVGVLVKKGLASGSLDPAPAIRFVLDRPEVACMVVGGLNLAHFAANVQAAP